VLLFILLFYLLDLVLVILTAIVIASAMEPGIAWFERRRIKRVAGAIIMYLSVAIVLIGTFYFFIPPIIDDLIAFLSTLPGRLQASGIDLGGASAIFSNIPGFHDVSVLQTFAENAKQALSGVSGSVVGTLTAIFGGVLSTVLIIVLSFYFAVQETGIDDFLRVIAPVKYQEYLVSLWKRSQRKIGLWMQGQVILALIVGVLVYLGLTILGVKYALFLAIISALFEIIPVFGPVLGAVPGILVAFADGGVGLALWVTGLYVIIQQFENHLIYPLVVRKVVGIPPLLVIIALVAGGELAGFLGILLSVPVAAAIKEYVDDVQKEKSHLKELMTNM
jgi:predicted PurR-regulated permease PerM